MNPQEQAQLQIQNQIKRDIEFYNVLLRRYQQFVYRKYEPNFNFVEKEPELYFSEPVAFAEMITSKNPMNLINQEGNDETLDIVSYLMDKNDDTFTSDVLDHFGFGNVPYHPAIAYDLVWYIASLPLGAKPLVEPDTLTFISRLDEKRLSALTGKNYCGPEQYASYLFSLAYGLEPHFPFEYINHARYQMLRNMQPDSVSALIATTNDLRFDNLPPYLRLSYQQPRISERLMISTARPNLTQQLVNQMSVTYGLIIASDDYREYTKDLATITLAQAINRANLIAPTAWVDGVINDLNNLKDLIVHESKRIYVLEEIGKYYDRILTRPLNMPLPNPPTMEALSYFDDRVIFNSYNPGWTWGNRWELLSLVFRMYNPTP